MDTLVVAVAQYAVFVVAAAALVVWLLAPGEDKLALAVQAVVAVLTVAVLVKAAGALHTDPRPFVVAPGLRPMFAHPTDNGFPSDHTALASGVAIVVLMHRRWSGLALLVVSVAIGAARVVAQVHHVEDIVAGLAIGAVAAMVGLLTWRALAHRRRVRVTGGSPAGRVARR